MKTIGQRVRAARGKMGVPDLARQLSEMLGSPVSYQALQQLENGMSGGTKYLVPLARVLGRNANWLFDETGPEFPAARIEALLVGKVGAGAEITRFDDVTPLAGIEPPPGLGPCNAAVISGDSQYPLQDGWIVFYGAEHQGVPENCVGKLCVVQVKDGPTLLKTLKRGRRKGLYDLESWNAPLREDQRILWASRVLDIRPT